MAEGGGLLNRNSIILFSEKAHHVYGLSGDNNFATLLAEWEITTFLYRNIIVILNNCLNNSYVITPRTLYGRAHWVHCGTYST